MEWTEVALCVWQVIDAAGLFVVRALLILAGISLFIWSLIG
jgi:hypothetical protein